MGEKKGYILRCMLFVIAACFFTLYMGFNSWMLIGGIVSVFLLFIEHKFRLYPDTSVSKRNRFAVSVFATFLSAAIVLGRHLHIDATQTYYGTITAHYVLAYHWYDLAAFLLAAYFIFKCVLLAAQGSRKYEKLSLRIHPENTLKVRWVLAGMAVMFVLWLPYLYVYYPGFYYGDSVISVQQALGQQPLDNHYPVMFAMLLRLCMKIGSSFGNLAGGLAVFSLLQMAFMAGGLSYFANWMKERFGLGNWLLFLLVAVFGASPYVAQYTVSIWKDPIFSVSVVLVTIFLVEIMMAGHRERKRMICLMTALLLSLLLMVFSRNNGLYIVYAILVLTVISLVKKDTRRKALQVLVTCLVVVGVSGYVTGPVYESWGVEQSDEKVESYGVFLCQMARVVAVGGDLSEEDMDYMNRLLPLDEYKTAYTPCCIDNLKWNQNFDKTVLEEDFFQTYLSILKKNPRICFEAWELQTFGFWSVNQSVVNGFNTNIQGGVPRNLTTEYGTFVDGLTVKTVDRDSQMVKLFPYDSRCIPVAYAHWLLIGISLAALCRCDWKRLVVLAPALGLIATLIVASPIFYWPRYGFGQQLLIPLFIIMIFVRENGEKKKWIK